MDYEEIEDMICYNLSYGIDVETTLSYFDNIDEDTKKYFIKIYKNIKI